MPAKKANTTPENIDVKETTAEMAVEKTRTTESAEDLIFNPEKKITIKSIACEPRSSVPRNNVFPF